MTIVKRKKEVMESPIKMYGTCVHWHTDRGYECAHAGFYGGDLNRRRHPYCMWETADRKEIQRRERIFLSRRPKKGTEL